MQLATKILKCSQFNKRRQLTNRDLKGAFHLSGPWPAGQLPDPSRSATFTPAVVLFSGMAKCQLILTKCL